MDIFFTFITASFEFRMNTNNATVVKMKTLRNSLNLGTTVPFIVWKHKLKVKSQNGPFSNFTLATNANLFGTVLFWKNRSSFDKLCTL